MIFLRDATPEDLPILAAAVSQQPLMMRYGTTAEALARNLAGALAQGEELLLAEENGQLAGMAWFLKTGTFALGGYLRLISVFPGCEGRGIGANLLNAVELRTATASRFLFLLVSDHNQGARRFYAGHGYTEAGELKQFLRDDVSEVVMWKKLKLA